MDLPFKAVSSTEELGKTLAHFADKDLILIDTAGRSQRDHHISEIKQFLRQSFPVEIYLVMSITCKENNLSAISQEYGPLPIDRLIFTKLDESCTYGTLLNQLARIKKPLSYLTTGQKVPEDIEIATQERIISLLLDETEVHYCYNEREGYLMDQAGTLRSMTKQRRTPEGGGDAGKNAQRNEMGEETTCRPRLLQSQAVRGELAKQM